MRVTAREPQPISMEAAVGYPNLDHLKEESIEGRLVLKHDRLFLLTNSNGDIAPAGGAALGLFLEDTRILSHYELRLAGGPAALLSSQLPEQYLAHIDLAVSPIRETCETQSGRVGKLRIDHHQRVLRGQPTDRTATSREQSNSTPQGTKLSHCRRRRRRRGRGFGGRGFS